MDKVYRSKVDWWVGLLSGMGAVAVLATAVAIAVNPPPNDPAAVWIALLMLPLGVFMGWILFSVYYTITAAELLVRAAVFRWRIPLKQITEVYPTHNPLSSPALSLDRLRITYLRANGRSTWVMISPHRQAQFLSDLAQAAGLQAEGNRLVRR